MDGIKYRFVSKLGVDLMKSLHSLALAVLVVVGFLLATQPATAHHSSAGINADVIKEITGHHQGVPVPESSHLDSGLGNE